MRQALKVLTLGILPSSDQDFEKAEGHGPG